MHFGFVCLFVCVSGICVPNVRSKDYLAMGWFVCVSTQSGVRILRTKDPFARSAIPTATSSSASYVVRDDCKTRNLLRSVVYELDNIGSAIIL